MAVSSSIQLHLFPRDDLALASLLERIATEAGGFERIAPEDLQVRLRAAYPAAVVRCGEPLGALDGVRPSWYVYRDGSVLGA
jgi:hypothetical protein